MNSRRLGTTLLSVAASLCDDEFVDAVALPIVADIQFEAEASAHRSLLPRAWVLARGCFVFVETIALAALFGRGRNPMRSQSFGWLRVLLAVPIALLVTAGVQRAAMRLFGMVLMHPGERLANGLVLVEGVNTTKIVSSPFMAAALFWTMYLIAPERYRSPIAVGALIVTGIWGGLMMLGAVMPWPRFDSWLVGLGLALWLGGGISYWVARRLRVGMQKPASANT